MIDERLIKSTFSPSVLHLISEFPNFVQDNVLELQINKAEKILKDLDRASGNRDLEQYIECLGELLYIPLKLIILSGMEPEAILKELVKSKVTLDPPDFSEITKASYEHWEQEFKEDF